MTAPWGWTARIAGATLLAMLLACEGWNDWPDWPPVTPPVTPPATPSAPTGVVAVGSLGKIALSWSASSGDPTGYNVYRKTEGSTFTKLNSSTVAATTYEDLVTSPEADGILYSYRVTAVGAAESDPSGTVLGIHGTRLTGTHTSSITTEAASSPYVVEGTLTLDAGNLTVATGTKLYVLDDAVIDVAAGTIADPHNGRFVVNGLLRVLAGATAHATFTSHKSGGLAAGQGFTLVFDGAVDYVPADDSGTLVRNTEVANLRSGGEPLQVLSSAPRFDNSKFLVNGRTEATFTWTTVQTAVIFTHCTMIGWYPMINADLHATDFKIQDSVLQSGPNNYYSLDFYNVSDPLAEGQISGNDIDGTRPLGLEYVGGSDIPLAGNYWRNGAPTYERWGSTPDTLGCTFTPSLTEPPAGVGPSW
jgi:hypothetical protein